MNWLNVILDKIENWADKHNEEINEALRPRGLLTPSVSQEVKKIRQDVDSDDLFVGKILDDSSIKCEVIEVHDTNIHVKILEIKWERLGTYLDAGKIYPVYKHRNGILSDDKMQVWEISPKRMKRSTSQVLLYWERGIGWSWDLDT